MALRLIITHNLEQTAEQLHRRLTDPRPIFQRFAQYMRVQTDNTFDRLRRGGSYRGVTWAYFAPQYMGRKRPSGARLREGDSLMQDTGTMRSRAALVMRQDRRTLILGPQGVRYAAAQQARRPFLFFHLPADTQALEKFALAHLEGK